MTRAPGVHLPGVVCPCGREDLVVVTPGTDHFIHPVAGIIVRGVAARGWCCIDHARLDGWPWLSSEKPQRIARAA